MYTINYNGKEYQATTEMKRADAWFAKCTVKTADGEDWEVTQRGRSEDDAMSSLRSFLHGAALAETE